MIATTSLWSHERTAQAPAADSRPMDAEHMSCIEADCLAPYYLLVLV
jgi:hypothetical protein